MPQKTLQEAIMNEFIIMEDFPKSEIEFDQRFLHESILSPILI